MFEIGSLASEILATRGDDRTRLKTFQVITVISAFAPLFGEFAVFVGSGEVSESLALSSLLSLSSLVAYRWFVHTKNLGQAIRLGAVLQLFFFGIESFTVGGSHAQNLIYLTFFPVANGFLLGRRAAILTSGYGIALIGILYALNPAAHTIHEPHSNATVALQASACLAFIGWIISTFVSERQRYEQQLQAAINTITQAKTIVEARENEIRKIYQTMAEGLMILDANQNTVEYNPAAASILGRPDEVLTRHSEKTPKSLIVNEVEEVMLADDLPPAVAQRTGQPVHDRVLGVRIPGEDEFRWLKINATPFRAKESVYVMVTFSDITELKRREEMLVESQSVAKLGHWSFHLRTGKITWSRELYNFHPIPKDSPPPDFETLCAMVHPEDRERFRTVVHRCVTTGEPYKTVHRMVFPDRIVWLEGHGRAKTNTEGEIVELVGTAQDVTESIEKQKLTNFILEALQIGVWRYDPVNQSLDWDDSMYKLFEVDTGSFTGHYEAWASALTPGANRIATEELNQALRGEKEFNTTFEIQTSTGKRKFIGARGTVIRNEKNEPLMMYGINWDRTKEIKTELEAEEHRRLLNAVLDNLPNMVFAEDFNNELRFRLINKTGCNLLGVNEKQVIGKNDFDFVPAEQAKFFVDKDREVFISKSPMKIDCEPIATPYGQRWLRTYKVPTFKPNGEPDLLIGISTDITEELSLQEKLELERAKSLHNSKLASLGEMSAGVAHEINNPLAVISANLKALKKFKDNPEKFDKKIEDCLRASVRIEKIVNGLRKFSRSTAQPHRTTHNLTTIVNEALVITESKTKRHSVRVEPILLPTSNIICDDVEIEQVVVNLLNNAVDAIKDQPTKWIRIETFEDADRVCLRVIDSGNGLSKEVETKLFQPFFTTKAVGEGTGLGLSITKGILDEHGATMAINRSLPNTCFEVSFPKAENKSTAA
jgi:PAS domain S-box-containing protein